MDNKEYLISGKYKVLGDIRKNSIFKWVRAKDISTNNTVLLQILCVECSQKQTKELFDHFDELISASKSKLFLPNYTFSDKQTPLCVVYDDTAFKTLSTTKIKTQNQALELWHSVSEQLFYLHNRNIIHGFISPDTLILIDNKVFIFNFGYAPLLQSGNELAIKEVGKFCASEIKLQNSVTPASDIYAFAKTVVHFHRELKDTDWYKNLTEEKSEGRRTRMRDVFKKLHQIFSGKKFILSAKADPDEGGEIEGTGKYISLKKVKVKAVANNGYLFDHWKGDLNSKENPYYIVMDSDKNIIAVFVKDPSDLPKKKKKSGEIVSKFVLFAKADPEEGGKIDGTGKYINLKKVKLTAVAKDGYLFDHWKGDLNSKENPYSIVMDSDKNIIAVFVKDPEFKPPIETPIYYKLDIESIPLGGGTCTGTGNYQKNDKVKIVALSSENYKFDRWKGNLKSKSNTVIVDMNSNKKIYAHFSQCQMVVLNLIIDPQSAGKIIDSQFNRNIKATKEYILGTKIHLRVIPYPGWSFLNWSGDIQGTSNHISLEMDKEKNIIAHFKQFTIFDDLKGEKPEDREQILEVNKHSKKMDIPGWASDNSNIDSKDSNTKISPSTTPKDQNNYNYKKTEVIHKLSTQTENKPKKDKSQSKKRYVDATKLGKAFE